MPRNQNAQSTLKLFAKNQINQVRQQQQQPQQQHVVNSTISVAYPQRTIPNSSVSSLGKPHVQLIRIQILV